MLGIEIKEVSRRGHKWRRGTSPVLLGVWKVFKAFRPHQASFNQPFSLTPVNDFSQIRNPFFQLHKNRHPITKSP